jgi:L-amino acid N-acyltransferase YncA
MEMAETIKRIKDVPKEDVLEFMENISEESKNHFRGGRQAIRPNSKGFVYLIDEKIVAVMYYFIVEEYGYAVGTIGMVTKKEHQNKGIQQKLYPHLEKLAVESNIKKFRADIDNTNSASLWMFLKLGFRLTYIDRKQHLYFVQKYLLDT